MPTKVRVIEFEADTPEETAAFGDAMERLLNARLGTAIVGGASAPIVTPLPALPDASGQATLGDPPPLLGAPAPLPALSVVGGASSPTVDVPPLRSGEGAGGEAQPRRNLTCAACGHESKTRSGVYYHREHCPAVVGAASAAKPPPASGSPVHVGGQHRCTICNKPFAKASHLARHTVMAHQRGK